MSDQKKLVLYVDPKWRIAGPHIPLLYPFWGNILDPKSTPFQWQLFETYRFDTRYYSITDNPQEASVVCMPYSHSVVLRYMPEMLEWCAAASARFNKPLLIDGMGDIEYPITTPNTIVLRYGGYRFEKKDNEIHLPLYADDLLERYRGGVYTPRVKTALPTVAFVGWAALSPMQQLRAVVKELPQRLCALFDSRFGAKKKGVFFRKQAMRVLQRSPLVAARFLVRTSYSGHADTASKDPALLREEFIVAMEQGDYCLDVRGDANGSIRLFEILSLGMIPIIIDTERNLPFSDQIEYKSFALIVDFRDMATLSERIAQFHAGLSQEQFDQMRRSARAAYLTYFRVDAILPHLLQELEKRGVLCQK